MVKDINVNMRVLVVEKAKKFSFFVNFNNLIESVNDEI